VNRSAVQKGDEGRICTQAFPVWYLAMLATLTGDKETAQRAETDPASVIPPPDPREHEDCLFLDVLVPEDVLARSAKDSYAGAPVMVWFYGGGFTFTDPSGNPAGLIRRSRQGSGGDEGIIYVKINYRVNCPVLALISFVDVD
jgi:carboxylesterase type B